MIKKKTGLMNRLATLFPKVLAVRGLITLLVTMMLTGGIGGIGGIIGLIPVKISEASVAAVATTPPSPEAENPPESSTAAPAIPAVAEEASADPQEVPLDQVTPPQLLHFENAPYPPEAREQGLTAAVVMALRIEEDGSVGAAQVLEGAGHGFDEAALAAVNLFRFEPARLGEQAIPVVIRFTYRFALEEVLQPVEGEQVPVPASASAASETLPPGDGMDSGGTAGDGDRTGLTELEEPQIPASPVHGRVLLRGHRTPLGGIGVLIRSNLPTADKAGNGDQADDQTDQTDQTDQADQAEHNAKTAGADQVYATVETDVDGRFQLKLPPGEWVFQVIHPDYELFETEESVAAREKLEVTYYLERKSGARYRSVVTARQARKSVTRTTLETMELIQVPGTFGEPFRVVQALPGVARTPFGLGFVVVRGAAPEDTGFYIDGFEIPLLYHFLSGPAVFQADLIESLDFYPGSFPVEYGRKMAGIITSTTKNTSNSGSASEDHADDSTRSIHGKLSVDLIDIESLITVPFGKDSHISAAFRRSHLDLLVRAAFPDTILPYYWDYQLAGNFAVGRGWRGKLTVFGSSDTLEFPSDPGGMEEDPSAESMDSAMGISFHQAQFSLFRPILNGGRFQVSAMGGYRLMVFGAGEEELEASSLVGGVKTLLQAPLIQDHLSLDVGFDVALNRDRSSLNLGNFGNFTMDFPAPGGLNSPMMDPEGPRMQLSQTISGWQPAAFISLNAIYGALTLIPGVRMDWMQYGAFQDFTIDPRLVARVRLAEYASLKGGVGVFHQPPGGAVGVDTDGTSDITAPWAAQYTVGAELTPLEYVDLDLTLFYNDYRDLVVYDDGAGNGATDDTGGPDSGGGDNNGTDDGTSHGSEQAAAGYVNSGMGRAYGLEMLIRHRPHGPFFGWIGYTLSRSERRDHASNDWELFSLDQTHILSVVGSYRLGKSWTVGLKFQLVSGNPTTPVIGSSYDVDTNSWVPVQGVPGSVRTPAFHQLDLRVDKVWTFNRWRLTGYLDIINVYNAKNTEFLYYNYDYSQSAPLSGIPFLPSLGVKGEF